MAEAAKAVDEDHTNEIQQRRELFSRRFSNSGLIQAVIYYLPLANNANRMTDVEPEKIHHAIMSNISFAELCEVWFFSKEDNKAFNDMCNTGDLDTLREFVSRVPGKIYRATETVNSSEEFKILRNILRYREPEEYTPDTSNRDIVNFGSMLRILDPAKVTLTEDVGKTFRRRLREFAFPLPHDDLIDRDDGDLGDVEIDYNAMRSVISKNMDLNETVFDEMVKVALWGIRERI